VAAAGLTLPHELAVRCTSHALLELEILLVLVITGLGIEDVDTLMGRGQPFLLQGGLAARHDRWR
jgi:hypothetical protein